MSVSEAASSGPQPGDELTLRIDGLGRGGDGFVRMPDGLLGFVPRTLPGETVRVRVRERRGRRVEAEALAVLHASEERVAPACAYFERCGGCQLQHLSYAGQLRAKRDLLVQKLARLLGPERANAVEPVVPAPSPLGYRNKNLLQRAEEGFGFHDVHGTTLVAVAECPLATPGCNAAMGVVRAWLAEAGSPCRDALLAVLVRSGREARHVIFVVDERSDGPALRARLETLRERLPGDGLFVTAKAASSRRALGATVEWLAGPESMVQDVGPVTLELAPASFAQVNSEVAAMLYDHVVSELGPQPEEPVLDLFCGSGALSLHLARRASAVLGVELDHRALEDARRSAARNGIPNVTFRAGRCETIAERLWKAGQRYRLATFNPPRLGMHPRLVEGIARLGITRAVYVSCSPPTLVRDLDRLSRLGYRVLRVRPFDHFAQTYHLEVAVTLEREGPR